MKAATANKVLEECTTVMTSRDLRAHVSPRNCWLAIDRVVYDVTAFLRHHPGGDVLMQAAGEDATVVFNGTHPRWVRDSLKRHPNIRAVGVFPSGEIMDPLFFDFQDHILQALGGETKSPLDWVSLAVLGTAFLGVWLGMMYSKSLLTYVALGAVHGTVSVLVGFLVMHGYNHGSFPRKPVWASKCAQYLGELIGGVNNIAYRWHHNLLHHSDPNGPNDSDVENWPFLRQRASQPHLFFHRAQWLYAYVLYAFALVFIDARFTFEAWFVIPRTQLQGLEFLLTKAANVTMFFLVPWLIVGLPGSTVAAGALARYAVAATFHVAVISLNHQQPAAAEEAGAALSADGPRSGDGWFRRTLQCTQDTAPQSWWLCIATGGLSLHVVHHTLPSLSIFLLPRATAAAREFLAARGLPYHSHATLWDGLWGHQLFLRAMGEPPSVRGKRDSTGSGRYSAGNLQQLPDASKVE